MKVVVLDFWYIVFTLVENLISIEEMFTENMLQTL